MQAHESFCHLCRGFIFNHYTGTDSETPCGEGGALVITPILALTTLRRDRLASA